MEEARVSRPRSHVNAPHNKADNRILHPSTGFHGLLSLRKTRPPLDVLGRDTIERVCREHGYGWRDPELDRASTVTLFVQQVAHGRTC